MKRERTELVIALAFCLTWLSACDSDYAPKPRGYFRIDLPGHTYQTYDSGCPYVFEYSGLAVLAKGRYSLKEPCWFNIWYPKFEGTIHLSYKEVDHNIDAYIEDAYSLANKHISKANDISEELVLRDSSRVFGLIYSFEGSTATSMQFYVTDSINHFLHGALYFNVSPNPDSIAPVDRFIKEDIRHLVNSLEWKPVE